MIPSFARSRALLRILLPAAIFLIGVGSLAAQDAPDDQSTPRRAVRMFLDSCREGKFDQAARVLDLAGAGMASAKGPELARHLKFVLDQKLWIDYALLSDNPEGDTADKKPYDVLGEIALGEKKVILYLSRRGGKWRISPATVRAIPNLYAQYGAGILDQYLTPWLLTTRVWELKAWQWIGLPLAIFSAFVLAWLFNLIGARIAMKVVGKTAALWDDRLVTMCRKPFGFFLGVVILYGLLELLRLSVPAQAVFNAVLQTFLIVAVVWFLLRFAEFLAISLQEALTTGVHDELKIRGVKTQLIVLRRIVNIALYVVAVSLILMQFDVVRRIGMSLLASAGIAGIVIGFAAQKSLGSMFAGIQLALTQPIRLGDTVIAEGEWGWIEEINLTYVVVKVWDLRRLVIPITHFLDKPFQNWTKVSPDILGTVYFHADFTVPVDKLRAELKRFVSENKLWDGKASGLLVTKATDRTVELRALISAADSGKQWDLRCETREHMLKYLQELEGGRYLPRHRLEQPPIERGLPEVGFK